MRKKVATAANPAPSELSAEPKPTTPTALDKPPPQGPPVSEEDIRLRAYQKWEAAGKPCGDGRNFWLEAEQELRRWTWPDATRKYPTGGQS
jgi:hypothetical protein